MTTTVKEIPINLIDVGHRLRDVCESTAKQYALSIEQSGLIHPILVRHQPPDRFDLVAGAHRLRAHELLGKDEIRADVRDLTDDEAELIEIEENLFRSDLSCAERIISLGLWDQAFKEAHPDLRQGGNRGNQHTGGKVQTLDFANFDEIMGQKTGRSRASNFNDLALFKALGVETLMDLRGCPIEDNAAQLKALSKLAPDQQNACAKRIADGDFASVKEWRAAVGDLPEKPEPSNPRDAWMVQILKVWGEGKKKWREDFLSEIGGA